MVHNLLISNEVDIQQTEVMLMSCVCILSIFLWNLFSQIYVTHTKHFLVFNILTNKCTQKCTIKYISKNIIHDMYQLLQVLAPECHLRGVY